MEPITLEYGAAIPYPSPVKTRCDFVRWSGFDAATMPARDLHLVAMWREHMFTLRFDTAGGSPIQSVSGAYGAPIDPPSNPVRTGYDFDGWSEDIPTAMPDFDMTVTATWSIQTHRLVFNSLGGSPVDDIVSEFGSPVEPPGDPVRPGYSFVRWSEPIPSTMPATDTSFRAVWEIREYRLTIDTCDGVSPLLYVYDYGEPVSLSIVNPTRAGHTFDGWSTPFPNFMPAEDVTIEAIWVVNRHMISFDTDGGTHMESITMDYGDPVGDIPDPGRTGYTFAGWSEPVPDSMPDRDISLKAIWRINVHTFVLESNNGSERVVEEREFGSKISSPPDPVRTGHTFKGWSSPVPKEMPDRDVFIEAVWEIDVHRIVFDTRGGTSIEPVVAHYGAPVGVVDDPVMTGHTFRAWSPSVPETMPDRDITVTACWDVDFYSLSVDLRDGSEPSVIWYAYDSPIRIDDPVREGHSFRYWSSPVPARMPACDLPIEAVWDVNRYRIIFDTSDGTPLDPVHFEYGAQVSSDTVPERTGHVFRGWDPAPPSVMPANDVVLKAVWDVNSYTITFDTCGGTAIEPITQSYGSAVTPPADPVREGSRFISWSTSIPDRMPSADIVVKANWAVNKYAITFDAMGGSPVSDIVLEYGSPVESPADPVRTGYAFKGWDKPIPGTMPATDVSVAAVWEVNTHAITFDSRGGTPLSPVEFAYGTEVVLPSNPVLKGHTFVSWNQIVPERMPDRDIHLEAVWRIDTHTVSFDTGGGTVIEPIVTEYGSQLSHPDDPVRTGHSFLQWNPSIPDAMPDADVVVTALWSPNTYLMVVDADDGGEVRRFPLRYGEALPDVRAPSKMGYTFSGWSSIMPETMPARDLYFKALWIIERHTITFDTRGGSAVRTIEGDYGSAVAAPDDPVRTGYRFAGWDREIPETMPATDMTISALWRIRQYALTFDPGNGSDLILIYDDYGSDVIPPSDPVRKGHTFISWNRPIPSKMPAESSHFEAKWKVDTHTITFDTRGGTPVAPITADYGTPIAKPKNPVMTGYTFADWNVEIPSTMPDEDLTATALWNVNSHVLEIVFIPGAEPWRTVRGYGEAIPEVQEQNRTGYTFAGWSAPIPKTMPDEDVSIKALWTIDRHTITFDPKGGSAVPAISGLYGSPVAAPEDPVREGYRFTGWDREIPDSIPSHDMVVTASWAVRRYALTFDPDNGSDFGLVVADYGTEVVQPSNPVREGYTFVSWNRPVPSKMPAESMVFTALWKVNTHTLSFDAGGGSSIPPVTADYDTELERPGDPVREGYTFLGWSPSMPERMPDETLTLKAQWKVNLHTLSFDPANGFEVFAIVSHYGTDVPAPQNPVREGYTFVSWGQTVPSSMPDCNIHFTARWSINTHTITFDSKNGSHVPPITACYGAGIAVPADPVRTGYIFKGWDAEIPCRMPDANITVSAVWEVRRCTLVVDLDNGVSAGYRIYDYGEEVSAAPEPVKTGCRFAGWSMPFPRTMPAEDLYIKALWIVNEYTISFDTGDGSVVPSIVQKYGSAISAPPAPTRTGHTFTSWSQELPSTMPATDVRLTAGWRINEYTVSFDANGGNPLDPVKVRYGDPAGVAPVPVRTGHTFASWSSPMPERMPAEDVVLVASWTVDRHTVSFFDGSSPIGAFTGDYGSPVEYPAMSRIGYTAVWDTHPDTVPDEDVRLTASWSANMRTLTYDTSDGRESVDIPYGSRIHVPEPGTRPGYWFAGWDRQIPSVMPDRDVDVRAVWTPTVKSGTGVYAGSFIADSGYTVEAYGGDACRYEHPTFGVDGGWRVSMDSSDIDRTGNLSVTVKPVGKGVLPLSPDMSKAVDAVYSVSIRTNGSRVLSTAESMEVTLPSSTPEGMEAVVWVMSDGDMVGVLVEDDGETVTFKTTSATYWAMGYVEIEEEKGSSVAYVVLIGAASLVAGFAMFVRLRAKRE